MHEYILLLKDFTLSHQRAVIGSLVFFIIVIVLLWLIAVTGGRQLSPDERAAVIGHIGENDWVQGDPKTARTVLIEYSDFECPACANYYDILSQLKSDTKGDIAVVYRHFPLSAIHPHAALAAQAAEAAGVQGKFFEMHDELFKNQREWSHSENPMEFFEQYARTIGVSEEQFKSDIISDKIVKKVAEAESQARALGIKGTPTFFANGEQLPSMRTYAEFKAAVLARTYTD